MEVSEPLAARALPGFICVHLLNLCPSVSKAFLAAAVAVVAALSLGSCAPAKSSAARPGPVVRFREVAAESGVDFRHVNGASPQKYFPETMGAGVAVFDYDNDG